MSVAWLRTGDLSIVLGIRPDPLGVAAAALVLVVGATVLAYSASYFRPDEGRSRSFVTMAFFLAAMLLLVLADTLVTLFVAWELVGLASYLLIGHRRADASAADAAVKAFLVTRVADLAFLAAVALTVVVTGSDALDAPLRAGPLLPLVAALMLAAALGKSAQLPFSAWLPDAMRGPTPVSALLHSATMVAAGAFLLVRLYDVFAAAGLLPLVAALGLASALYAGLAALAQSDLKRVLAYSTIAQLAEMIAAVGLGVPLAALLLLAAHAFYKSALFLVAGELEHAAGTTEMAAASRYRLGLLSRAAFAVAALALVGIPVSIAPSPRDAVVAAGLAAGALPAAALLLAAVLTGAYVARAARLVFFARRPREAAPRQAGLSLPPAALALGLVAFGVATSPLLGEPLQRRLEAELGSAPSSLAASLLAVGAGLTGLALGWRPPVSPRGLADAARRGFGLDRALSAIAGGAAGAMHAAAEVERARFDPFARALASRALALFAADARFDREAIDRAAERFAGSVAGLSERARGIPNGLIERYLVAIGAWVLALVGLAAVAAFAGRP